MPISPTNKTLPDWLKYIENLHPKSIDLRLERVAYIKQKLPLQGQFPLITIGGTNGKGSICAMLESILYRAGYRVGCYTSPHLLKFNERIRVNSEPVSDEQLIEAFNTIEVLRGEIALTFFEFTTLAAWHIFSHSHLDVLILEVGLGGRLDAVNAFDTDCAVISSIDIDHKDYLGDTREKIAFEKAGIFRPHKPVICGDPNPPQTLIDHANHIHTDLQLINRDFGFKPELHQWAFWGREVNRSGLAYPNLRGAKQLFNAATTLAALDTLKTTLPITMQDIRKGFALLDLPGRFQVLPGRPTIILDVAHNPQAISVLADNLKTMGQFKKTFAVFAMLGDKDIAAAVSFLKNKIDHWFIPTLTTPRALPASEIAKILIEQQVGGQQSSFSSSEQAFAAACQKASENDRIIAFGSFYLVADILAIKNKETQRH